VSYHSVELVKVGVTRRCSMAFTANSTLGEIIKEKPNAKEIIAKHAGQPVDESQLAMAMSMTVQQVAGFVGWNQEKIEAFLKDINES
jgi:hypothetical protein